MSVADSSKKFLCDVKIMAVPLLKQYADLARNIANFSDGQARISEDESDLNGSSNESLETITLILSPNSGPYKGGTFIFKVFLKDFPHQAPAVTNCTPIYHPNIDEDNICLNLLDELWSSKVTLEDIVQGILFLLHYPNINDPVSKLFWGVEKYCDYRRNVRLSLRGNTVEGCTFHRNLPDNFLSDDDDDDDDDDRKERECEEERVCLYYDSSCDVSSIDEDTNCSCTSDLDSISSDEQSERDCEVSYPVQLKVSYPVQLKVSYPVQLNRSVLLLTSFPFIFSYGFLFLKLFCNILNRTHLFLNSRLRFWLSGIAGNCSYVVRRYIVSSR